MPAVSELSEHTGYLMRMVSNAVSHAFARRLAEEGVTVSEWTMLRSLYREGLVNPSVLASKMGMTKGAISKLADRLEEKGLVKRAVNLDDRRRHMLSLSTRGAKKVPILASLADENDAAFLEVLGKERRDQLRQLLHVLISEHGLSGVPID